MFWFTCSVITLVSFDAVFGHGMMLEPSSRSSLWRTNSAARINYDDNGLFCGGFHVQFDLNGGRCGVCGDSYNSTHPQDNENTGKFGQGIIAAAYASGTVIDVHVNLTANHKGTFNYSLCALEDPSKPEPEDCFVPLKLVDGTTKSVVSPDVNYYINRIQLPHNVTCERCVFRWTYRAGNNWGVCENGTQTIGCGSQEHFRNCADIIIY